MQTEEHDIEIRNDHLHVTVCIPTDDGPAPRPTVLIVSGIAYEANEQPAEMLRHTLAEALTEAGFFVVMYTPRAQGMILDDFQEVGTDDQVDEASAVFRWIHLQELTDPKALDVIGIGLGSVVVAGLLNRSVHLDRTVLIAPVLPETVRTKWTTNGTEPARVEMLPDRFVNDLTNVDTSGELIASGVPTMLVHGAADTIAPVENSLEIERAMQDADAAVNLWLVPFADHYFSDNDARSACAQAITQFLQHA
ncbi:MAG: prolyl oligopeptidase family serine peptidase [Planctomycetota bacterium]